MERQLSATMTKADGGGPSRRFNVVASTGALDRDRDRISPGAWDLLGYRRNPAVFANHDHQSLPVARALDPRIEDGRLVTTIEFPPPGISAAADEVHDLVASGFLRGVSVGFKPSGGTPNLHGGLDYDKAELLEISLVGIPSNPESLVVGPAKALATKALAARIKGGGNPTGYGATTGPEHARGTGDPTRDPCG